MSEFYLCHIALVGARMSAFQDYGFTTRNDLSLRRVAPNTGSTTLNEMPHHKARSLLIQQLPIW